MCLKDLIFSLRTPATIADVPVWWPGLLHAPGAGTYTQSIAYRLGNSTYRTGVDPCRKVPCRTAGKVTSGTMNELLCLKLMCELQNISLLLLGKLYG